MPFYAIRCRDNVQASVVPGAQAGDFIILDSDFRPVPGERHYAPYERERAEERARQLNIDESLKDVPDIFEGLFDEDDQRE